MTWTSPKRKKVSIFDYVFLEGHPFDSQTQEKVAMKKIKRFLTIPNLILLFGVASVLLLHPSPAESQSPIALLNHRVVDAEYNKQLDRIVTVSATPFNQLHVVDPLTGTSVAVDLPLSPACVSVGPDGLFAAVGHNGCISYVNLSTPALVKILPVTTDVLDIVLAGNGWVYAFPRVDQWETIRCVNLESGVEVQSGGYSIYAGTLAKLHPSGNAIYGADNGLSPSDIEKYDISQGTAVLLYDSPYHGDYSMCGNLWISEDGFRIFTKCGNVFRSSQNTTEDMVYNGSLGSIGSVADLSHSTSANKVFAIPGNTYDQPANRDTEVWKHDYTFLSFESKLRLPAFSVNNQTYPSHGKFVFFSADGSRYSVVLQADPNSGMLLDHGIFTLGTDIAQFFIHATAGSGGTITPSGAVAVYQGDSQGFTIAPSTGYHLLNVMVDGSLVGAVTSYEFTNVPTDHIITPIFAIDTPGTATLVSPTGITDNTPTYTWNAVSNAAEYYLWVDDSTGNRIQQWYTASAAGCGGGTGACSLTPATTLSPGAYQWRIQARNSRGLGPWSAWMSFVVEEPCTLPLIITHPQSQTILSGQTATFSVTASGTTPFTYQWYQGPSGNTSAPVGTNSSRYTTPALTQTTSYWVRVTNFCGSANSNTATLTVVPAAPPSPPTNVSASDGTYVDRVELTWAASPGATSYTVYRATSLARWVRKTVLGTSSGTLFNDTTAVPKTTYYYWVTASNAYGTSSLSAYNAGQRSDGSPPAPTNVSASDGTYLDKVEVAWPASSGATSYTVYRATSLATWVRKVVLGTTSATLFNDTTAVPKTTYYYWVVAANAYGTSSLSPYDAGQRSDGSPPAPTNVSASDGTYLDKVEVAWPASSGATSYTVYRATSLYNWAIKTILGTTSGTSFNDTTAIPGRTYYYWVRASNAYGTSKLSAYDAGHR